MGKIVQSCRTMARESGRIIILGDLGGEEVGVWEYREGRTRVAVDRLVSPPPSGVVVRVVLSHPRGSEKGIYTHRGRMFLY